MPQYPELRAMVRGAYDLQQLRMQMGLRCVANFRAKLKVHESDEGMDPETGELSEEAESVLDKLRDSFRRLTDGIARNRTLPEKNGFVGDELISTYAELVLVSQYIAMEAEEAKQFRQFKGLLEDVPIYMQWLKDQRGVGPAMAGVILTAIDIHRAKYPSSIWKYAGIDVGPDGRGRSRRAEHLVEREYINKKGKTATRMSVTYNPWLKTKLMGVLAGSFLRSASPWRKCYDDYKHRLETDPARTKVTVAEWKKRKEAGEEVSGLWTPGRINDAAKRYMIKQFLVELYKQWRPLEGLVVHPPYHEWKHGHQHGNRDAA